MNYIEKYFSGLSASQEEQFAELLDLYKEWNARINVISRKDIDNLYLHHVLPSLGIAKIIRFRTGSEILDAGTGGGFPGIPLAILFPQVNFHLVDSIGKKITVVQEVSKALGLKNVTAEKSRAEDINRKYDFVVSRAVSSLDVLYGWFRGKIKSGQNNEIPNGILYLKGGELEEELKGLKCKAHIYSLSDYFEEEFFSSKHLVHLYHHSQ